MSSELERLLRAARHALPGSDAAATTRARTGALAQVGGKRRPRSRSAAALGAALLVATGLGVGLGALITPSGTAAPAPAGVGFLPERGWSVLQNGGDGSPARPAAAIAANVSLSPADGSDGLPYATLRALPPHGIVMVVGFVEREHDHWQDNRFPRRGLPLDVRDAAPSIEWGVQVRPERPLGQYQLLAAVNGYNVDVNLYFGAARPSQRQFDAAQLQLDRLVVRAAPPRAGAPRALSLRPSTSAATAPTRVIDRTFVCTVAPHVGVRFFEVSAVTGFRDPDEPKRWRWAAGAEIEGARLGFASSRAGAPMERLTRWLYVDPETCKAASGRVLLSPRGLVGGAASQLQGTTTVGSDSYRCVTPRRFLLRVRAVFRTPTALRVQHLFAKRWLTTSTAAVATEVKLAARTEAGKQLAYTEIFQSGKARLFASKTCKFE
ncbi:MAG TPA: hypothetical protein VML35_01070 [Gaiellaceae bacterium]|nr:hypothetical protein [Gaiellaceae bacterium]